MLKRSPAGETWLFSAHFIPWDRALELKTRLSTGRAVVPVCSGQVGKEAEQDDSSWPPLAEVFL